MPTGSCSCRTTGRSPRAHTRTCCWTARSTAAWSPAPWTSTRRRWVRVVDLLATSPDTWRDRSTEPPVIPTELVPPREGSFTDRVTALRRRHALRERRALENYAQSRKPERGWPVADNQAVLHFLRALLRDRKRVFVVMVFL